MTCIHQENQAPIVDRQVHAREKLIGDILLVDESEWSKDAKI